MADFSNPTPPKRKTRSRFFNPLATGLLLCAAVVGGCKKDEILDLFGGQPTVRIVSPVKDASVAPGIGRPGAGSFDGSGFAINVEIITHDTVAVPTRESLNIRNTAALGSPNVNIPGLTVTLDTDLIKPDGGTIAKGINLASLFNIAGTDDTPGPGVTTWVSWHVLESLPAGTSSFVLTVSVKDRSGRTSSDQMKIKVAPGPGGALSGQALTPATPATPAGDGIDDADGPEVTMIAPRTPTSVSTGPTTTPAPPVSGALFFVQVSALDKSRNGIGLNENADGKPDADRGTIVDATQSKIGINRYVTGLKVTFDVPLVQPNGNIIPAGGNLAPVFNTAGSEVDPSGYVRSTFGWTVGGSLQMPAGKTSVTIKAAVTDNAGKTGSTTETVLISPVVNGQALTPNP